MSEVDERFEVSFSDSDFDSQYPALLVPEGESLSECLDATNSPVLFGCRTGICGTCLVNVEGSVLPPDDEEQEMLELYAPDNRRARLACQLKLTGAIRIKPLGF